MVICYNEINIHIIFIQEENLALEWYLQSLKHFERIVFIKICRQAQHF